MSTAAACILSACARVVFAADGPAFTMSRIDVEGKLTGYRSSDLDGDGRGDLVAAVSSETRGRELLVFTQSPSGRFPARPSGRIPLKRDVVAFAFADVRQDPGAEVLLWTPSGCFSYSATLEGYAGNARRLLRWELLSDIPDRDQVFFHGGVCDVDGDGSAEVLAPGIDGFGLFARGGAGPNGELELRARFPAEIDRRAPGVAAPPAFLSAPRSSQSPQEASVARGRFDGLVLLEPEDRRRSGSLLAVHRWTESPVLADADGDGRLDWLVLQAVEGGRELRIRFQDGAGGFPETRSWSGPIPGGGALLAEDFDGDGGVDLVSIESDGGETKLLFLRNRRGSFAAATPDQVMRFSGFGVRPEIVDLDGDGRPELAVTSHSVPATGVLHGARVERRLYVYRQDAERVFERRPAARFEESFTAKEFLGLGQAIALGADLAGDGRRAAVFIGRDGSIVAHRVLPALEIESRPFFTFTPPKMVLSFRTLHLDADGRSDIVLLHHRALTVLVSR